jgi:hypothetical protein
MYRAAALVTISAARKRPPGSAWRAPSPCRPVPARDGAIAMSSPKPPEPPDHELHELVPGDAASIRASLRWLTRVDRMIRDAGGALLAERQGWEAPPSSRAVLEERASQQLLQLAEVLYAQEYRAAVAPHVAARLEPLVVAAVNACHILADAVRGRPLGYERAVCHLNALKTPRFELQKLTELLAAALAEKTGGGGSTPPQPAAAAASPPAERELIPTERRILTLCRRKAIKGERLANKHLQLSYDYVRRLLARLVREGRLRNTNQGYRAV